MTEEENKKERFYKYLGLFFATLLGSFLAVYFVTDVAINRLMNPFATIHQMDREFARMNRDMMFVRELPPNHIRKHNTIDFFRTPDEYKFIIDLKPFNNNINNIKINSEGHDITISGEANIKNKHSETFNSFSQTYTLDDDANLEKMTKKKVNNRYIITIPLEDND